MAFLSLRRRGSASGGSAAATPPTRHSPAASNISRRRSLIRIALLPSIRHRLERPKRQFVLARRRSSLAAATSAILMRRAAARQDRPRLRRVGGNLRLERIEPGEFLLRPEIVDEGDTEMTAIEVAGEIEEMDLEPEVAAAEGRAPAEIGDAVDPGTVRTNGGAHGIDAGSRTQIVGEVEIGGGKADRAATLVALLDAAVDLQGRPSNAAAGRGLPSTRRVRIRVEE